jgi:hypothetical protein
MGKLAKRYIGKVSDGKGIGPKGKPKPKSKTKDGSYLTSRRKKFGA